MALALLAPAIDAFGIGTTEFVVVGLLPGVASDFGVGMVIGNLIGGRYADRALMPLLYVSLSALAVVLGLFTLGRFSESRPRTGSARRSPRRQWGSPCGRPCSTSVRSGMVRRTVGRPGGRSRERSGGGRWTHWRMVWGCGFS